MKKNISINLQGLIFHIEEDGYDLLSRYLAEVKAHFARFRGHQDIVADIEGRMAEIFAARLSPTKQVITLADVEEMQAKMGRVSDFADVDADEDDAEFATADAAGATATASGNSYGPEDFGRQSTGFGTGASASSFGSTSGGANPDNPAADEPRRLFRDTRHGKIAGVAAGLGHYFKVNPVWIRLAFVALLLLRPIFHNLFDFDGDGFRGQFNLGGLSLIAYIILWIVLPKRDDAPEPISTLASTGPWAGRRLFRDVDRGKIGGVAAGLAHYFQTDVVLVRVILLAGLFVGGFTFILYLILWVAVPVARTVSEKLQMRGDDVTLAGIASSLDATEGQPVGGNANARPLGRFLEGAAQGATPLLNTLGTIIRWGVAALLLVMGIGFLTPLIGTLIATLGILPAESVVHFGDNQQQANAFLRLVPDWGALAGFLALGIPTLALFLLAYRLVFRRPLLGRSGSLVLLSLWILSVVVALLAASKITNEFQETGTAEQSTPLARSRARSLTLDLRDQTDYMESVSLRFAPADSNSTGSVDVRYRAKGATTDAARRTAAASVSYGFTQRPDSVLLIDEGISLKPDAPFRDQDATVTLRLPVNKTYLLTARFIDRFLDDDDFTNNNQPRDNNPHRARFTAQGQFECLDCPAAPAGENEASNNDSDDDDSNDGVDLNINGENVKIRLNGDDATGGIKVDLGEADFNTAPGYYDGARRTFTDLEEFEEIEASSAFRVVVRPGDVRRVEAAGRESDLSRLRVRVRNGKLQVDRNSRNGLFSSFNFNDKPVLLTVTMPRLSRLELTGACQADVSGFNGADGFALEESGACTARIRGLRAGRVSLDLSGASRADLFGQAETLDVDGSGVCVINAQNLKAANASFELSGASTAKTNVENELRADLSGSSHVKYAGKPQRIEKDLSGASSVKAL